MRVATVAIATGLVLPALVITLFSVVVGREPVLAPTMLLIIPSLFVRM